MRFINFMIIIAMMFGALLSDNVRVARVCIFGLTTFALYSLLEKRNGGTIVFDHDCDDDCDPY